MVIFKQADFSGGLDRQLDPAKSPDNAYPLLVNARIRRNVVSPTNRNIRLSLVSGNYQGLYAAGQYLVAFVDGLAYYADVNNETLSFQPVSDWTTMSPDVARIYAEIVPATNNFFNVSGNPDTTGRTFNGTIAAFPQAMFVFDGINQPQAILPTGSARVLGTYASWTKNNPEYVPIGLIPAIAGNKLFLASADRLRVLHSVTGRASDFVINLDVTGNKGGDAETVATAVSYNEITALRALSTNQILVSTLYGTFVIELDYDNTIFGEPFLRPVFLFPAGALNEISIVDILQDTAFITQSGIHAFNAVAQAKRESNNFPLGAKIRGLLANPQEDTCAALHDDFAYFAVNTIHGYGALVYDTITQGFQSLDLSFGRVKQFANTKVAGLERLFYITHNNEIFEAFAGEEKNTARMYLGDWTPDEAPANALVNLINGVFANVKSQGTLKMSMFRNNELHDSIVLQCTNTGYEENLPIIIPGVSADKVFAPEWQFADTARGWRMGLLFEWDFDGDLTDVSLDGSIDKGPIVIDTPQTENTTKDILAFFADSGYSENLNTGGSFPAENFLAIAVTQGERYVYVSNGNGVLVNGSQQIAQGIFVARGDHVHVSGTGTKTFFLYNAEDYCSVLGAIEGDTTISAIIHGGNFAYPDGLLVDVTAAKLPVHLPIHAVGGDIDIGAVNGTNFYNKLQVPNYYTKAFEYVDFFFFNGSTVAPDGWLEGSVQHAYLRFWLANSTKPFKIIVVNQAPYTNDLIVWPGRTDLRYLISEGASAILSGNGHVMERFSVNDFPLFVVGSGGQPLNDFAIATSSAFRDNTHFGYLKITADALTCRMQFIATDGTILDTHDLYA